MIQRCGCIVERHKPSGILWSVVKCASHHACARDPETLDAAYYRELGLEGGNHVAELVETTGPLPLAWGRRQALEIGCGVSPYVGAIQAAGWDYLGLDASRWAAWETARRWRIVTTAAAWEVWEPACRFGLILCAHALEHMANAPAAAVKMAEALELGGELRIVVPDDRDLCNPDHLWFFDAGALRRLFESAGLDVAPIETRAVVPHEDFLYLRARKPGRA